MTIAAGEEVRKTWVTRSIGRWGWHVWKTVRVTWSWAVWIEGGHVAGFSLGGGWDSIEYCLDGRLESAELARADSDV